VKSKSLFARAHILYSGADSFEDAPSRVLLYSSQPPIPVPLLNGISGRGRVYHNFHSALILSRMLFANSF
jgi:hypothetical protein